MAVFFSQQMDYIYFLYGLGYFLLGSTISVMRIKLASPHGLKHLGISFYVCAFYEWFLMLSLSLGGAVWLSIVIPASLAVALFHLFLFMTTNMVAV